MGRFNNPWEHSVFEMFKKFLKEEKAQVTSEHIILAGGIIVCAVLISLIYIDAQEAVNSCGDHPECP